MSTTEKKVVGIKVANKKVAEKKAAGKKVAEKKVADKMTKEPVDDVPQSVYAAIPFDKCVVSGSFALYHYLKATGKPPKWKPNDVDVACKVKTYNELHQLATGFAMKAGASFTKHQTQGGVSFDRDGYPCDVIVGSDTLSVAGSGLPIQFVGFTDNTPGFDIHRVQEVFAEGPTGVSFTPWSQYGGKVFAVAAHRLPRVHGAPISGYENSAAKWVSRGWKAA